MSHLFSRLFKGITVVLTAMGAVVIIWQEAQLIQDFIASTRFDAEKACMWNSWAQSWTYASLIKNIKLLLIASAVEIALVWLLVLLDVINRRRGLIATLVLSILVGITIFIVYATPLSVPH